MQKVSGARPISVEQCKGKVDTCKKEWQLWAALRQQSGFGVVDGQVVADAEVLADYFRAHPKAEKFKNVALPLEDLHWELFEGYYATGEAANTVDELLQSQVAESIEDNDSLFTLTTTDLDSGNELPRRKRAGTATGSAAASRREKRARNMTAEGRMGIKLDDMARQIGELATAIAPRDYQQQALIRF